MGLDQSILSWNQSSCTNGFLCTYVQKKQVFVTERYTIGKNYYYYIFELYLNCMNYVTVVVIRLLPRCASI